MKRLTPLWCGLALLILTMGIYHSVDVDADAATVILQYEYRDAETPIGKIDGTNARFTLLYAPSPAASLQLYRNGLLTAAGSDYTLSGSVVTFVPAAIPQAGDLLMCFYRK